MRKKVSCSTSREIISLTSLNHFHDKGSIICHEQSRLVGLKGLSHETEVAKYSILIPYLTPKPCGYIHLRCRGARSHI
jgi:hypothetical protein